MFVNEKLQKVEKRREGKGIQKLHWTARDWLREVAFLDGLGDVYYAQGRYEEAVLLLERSLSIYEEKLGREHPTTQTIRENHIVLLQMMGQGERAKRPHE